MASVFGGGGGGKGPQVHNGAFRADDLELTLGGVQGPGALIQQANFSVTRTVNLLYEIGSVNVYYVGNRRQGQCQMSRVVGGSANFTQLLTEYGNMCEPKALVMTAKGGCGKGGATYTLEAATLTTVGASVTAQDVVITENLAFICIDIDVEQA
jgi:hypothetical protein